MDTLEAMDTLDTIGEEVPDFEGSGPPAALTNSSLDSIVNITNLTFFPYYQHTVYVAATYIVAYFFIFVLCMAGNILVCLIVLENRRMRTVTNLFIFNLAISDLLVGIFCVPTTLVDNLITGWPFSNPVCKMTGFVQTVSVSASVFTLVAIAIERFRCIVYPLQPKPTIVVAKVSIALIWLLAVAISLPTVMALTVRHVPNHYMVLGGDFNNSIPFYSCYENFTNPKMSKVYTAVLFTHIYLLPLTFITLMYGSIGVKLYSSVVANREPQQAAGTVQARCRRNRQQRISQKKIRVIKMLIVVALLFLLSWLPLWTLLMMADFAGLDRDQIDLLASYIFPFAHWLAFSNSSINPIIYGYYNENFKRGFQAVCKSKPLCCVVQCGLWRRVACCGRKKKNTAMQTNGGSGNSKDGTCNHLVMAVRNRVHNDNNLIDSVESNKSARVECVVVHSEKSTLEAAAQSKQIPNSQGTTGRVSSAGASVYHAWDN
uniref:Neuropeptide FF receptor 1 n=1 Tax=Neogobius melanostomus TaxID=47308 RepID=A0A8C6TLB6_9GOBI